MIGELKRRKPKTTTTNDILEGTAGLYENIEPDLDKATKTRASSRDPDLDAIVAEIWQRDQQGQGLRILQPKQLITRLPVLIAQVRAGNNSKSLLNEIQKIAYYLLQSRHITKKVYNNILRFVKGNTYK